MGLEKRLERIANHYGYPEDLPSTVSDDVRDAIGVIKRLGAEIDNLRVYLAARSAEANILRAAMERIAAEHGWQAGMCQTDVEFKPALSAEEAHTLANDVLWQLHTTDLPGMDWELSDETKQQMAELDRASALAAAHGGSVVLGPVAFPTPSEIGWRQRQGGSE